MLLIYPVRNNAPLLCSGVTFYIIPAGFNPWFKFLEVRAFSIIPFVVFTL